MGCLPLNYRHAAAAAAAVGTIAIAALCAVSAAATHALPQLFCGVGANGMPRLCSKLEHSGKILDRRKRAF